MRVIPSYAFKFGFNDYYRAFVKRQNFFNQPRPKTDVGKSASSGLSFGEMFLAGSMAGYTQITLTYPLEVMRSRLALDAGMGEGAQYKGVMDCAGRIFREEGLRGLYKGLAPTYASGIPYIATQMTFYTTFQRMLPVDEQGNSPVWAKLCAGASAGVIAQSLSFPGDTLRKRMQNDGIGGKPKQYKGLIDACKQIMRQEGPKAFYHGIKANMISALPGTAIQFVAFDMLKSAMQVDN